MQYVALSMLGAGSLVLHGAGSRLHCASVGSGRFSVAFRRLSTQMEGLQQVSAQVFKLCGRIWHVLAFVE